MEQKHQVHNLIVLDESGSMESIKTTIIQGFNEIVQTVIGVQKQFLDQDHFITFVTFNGLGTKTLLFRQPVDSLSPIDAKKYNPDASTPLYDALGSSIGKLRASLSDTKEYNVLVTILTDGEENASKEFSGLAIKNLIEELKQKNWTFTYIGTDHDVDKIAQSLSISNVMKFDKNEEVKM